MLPKKQKENAIVWYIVIGFIILTNFPFLIPIVIIGTLFYFVFFSKSGKRKTFESFFKPYTDIFEESNSELFKKMKQEASSIKSSRKVVENIEEIEQEVFSVLLTNKRIPNESLLEQKIENIFMQYDLDSDVDTRQKVLEGAYKKLLKVQEKEEQYQRQENIQPKKFEYSKHRKKPISSLSKKFTSSRVNTSSFPSIWDDYESVIDIMERDKK